MSGRDAQWQESSWRTSLRAGRNHCGKKSFGARSEKYQMEGYLRHVGACLWKTGLDLQLFLSFSSVVASALRFSISNDLKFDAERDLKDINAQNIPVHALNKVSSGGSWCPKNDVQRNRR